MTRRVDVAIVGGGHNALTAAAYLARAGKTVTVLERLDAVGGAAVSVEAFPGVGARLSRYSYLVSLLPRRIVDDLDLDIRLARRRYASYTPVPGTGRGLLIDTADPVGTERSFAAIGAAQDAAAFRDFSASTAQLARTLFPTMTEPLMTRREARRLLASESTWADLIENPVGSAIERRFSSDLVRGLVATDALIGTFAPTVDHSLAANRCLLYHVIGGGTGDWDVPIGGMGAVSGALWHAAVEAGAEILTGAEVTSIATDGEVVYRHEDAQRRLVGTTVLAGIAPAELARLLGDETDRPEGAQVKVNLVVSRLPRLRDATLDPEAAFGGTFHVNEGWTRLGDSYREANAGRIPDPMPCEVYCHSLTDPSILTPDVRASGAQTLTVFALQAPHRLVTPETLQARRSELQDAVLRSLDSVLAEPIADLLMTDADGRPCIETTTTLDLEDRLRMPGGNIFHGALEWPWADDDADLSTPAARWGVTSPYPGILLCGSGARRGGAVSGLGGHNAAMAILEAD